MAGNNKSQINKRSPLSARALNMNKSLLIEEKNRKSFIGVFLLNE